MKRATILLASLALSLHGQTATSPANDKLVSSLQTLFAPVGITVEKQVLSAAGSSQRLTAQLGAQMGIAARSSAPMLTVVKREKNVGPPARRRALELSPDLLVVASLDAQGRLRDWTLLRDPRTVRAEFPANNGQLTGARLDVANPYCLVDIPDDPAIAEIRIYQPVWSGRSYDLQLIGRTSAQ